MAASFSRGPWRVPPGLTAGCSVAKQSRSHHPLAAWCRAQGWTQARLADELGCAPGTVTRLLTGAQRPSEALAARIDEITGGAVTVRLEPTWCVDGVPHGGKGEDHGAQ